MEGWISIALPMAVMFFLMSTILGILSEYIYMLAQHSGEPAGVLDLEGIDKLRARSPAEAEYH